ncbi:MAG: nucleoside triphosphate pyrophosphohydrolase [Clostridia bacterium]|nr:nucleoside triphosphate pyrophosphohydrolase [Clostridia bacterium]
MEKVYHKLIRDGIPALIEAEGKTCRLQVLTDEEYLVEVDKKLDEELAEYHKDQNLEELADLLEVLYAAVRARGYTISELEDARAKKHEKRGGFDKKLLLISVDDGK